MGSNSFLSLPRSEDYRSEWWRPHQKTAAFVSILARFCSFSFFFFFALVAEIKNDDDDWRWGDQQLTEWMM
jgi:hypothetical protein